MESARREQGRSELVALAVKVVFIAALAGAVLRLSGEGLPWAGLSIVGTLSAAVVVLAALLDWPLCREAARAQAALSPAKRRAPVAMHAPVSNWSHRCGDGSRNINKS